MTDASMTDRSAVLEYTTDIVASYTSAHSLDQAALVALIGSVFAALSGLAEEPAATPEALVPAVSIRKSVTDDYLICLEDGKKLKMLKRHLMTSYVRLRQDIARQIGLGRRPKQAATTAPVNADEAPAPKTRRSRAKAAA